jgi:hypothetical protein
MRNSYKRRPGDFKRRVISRVYTSRGDLLEEEHKWLSLISDSEIGVKYYNLTKHLNGHWTSDEDKRLTVGQKISAKLKGRVSPNKGKKSSEATKQKIREANARQFSDPTQKEIRREKTKQLWLDPDYRRHQTENKKGVKQSADTLAKRQQTIKDCGIKLGPSKGNVPWNKGIKNESLSRSRWWNNSTINKRSELCPGNEYVLGRI